MLTKDQILSASDLPSEKLAIPEWGGDVYIRTMSGTERDSFEQEFIDSKKGGASGTVNIRARLAVRVVVDDKGNRLFTDSDADTLGKKSGKALDRIFDVAQRLSGIGDKDVKSLEGN